MREYCYWHATELDKNNLFTVMGGKSKFSAQGCDLAPKFGIKVWHQSLASKFGNVTNSMVYSPLEQSHLTEFRVKYFF